MAAQYLDDDAGVRCCRPLPTSLPIRMARWGSVIVLVYLVALVTPLLVSAGLLPDANAGC